MYMIASNYSGMTGLNVWGTVLLAMDENALTSSCDANKQWSAMAKAILLGNWAALGLAVLVR